MIEDTNKSINIMNTICPNPDCGVVKSLKEVIAGLLDKLCAAESQIAEKAAIIEQLQGKLRNQSSKLFGVSSGKSRYFMAPPRNLVKVWN